jgi:hypothetical protein
VLDGVSDVPDVGVHAGDHPAVREPRRWAAGRGGSGGWSLILRTRVRGRPSVQR